MYRIHKQNNLKFMKKPIMKNLKVVHTTNLGQFKYFDENREYEKATSKRRIKRIADSMNKDGLLVHPMIVTRNFTVVDGQHRLGAAKIAGLGIYYMVDPTIPNAGKGLFDAARALNKESKPWSKFDYIHGYSSMGKEGYGILEEFGKKYPMFSLTERLMLLQNSGTKHADKSEFADGKFNVVDANKAELWANQILSLRTYFEKGYNKSVFVRTLLTIMEKKREFRFEEFIRKVKLRPTALKLCGDKRSYSELIEDIYNFKRRSSEKLNLRF